MPLITPEGTPVFSTERIMLLTMWSHYLSKKLNPTRPSILSAAMGKPTFPVNEAAARAGENYWHNIAVKSREAREVLNGGGSQGSKKISAAIDYGEPEGEQVARAKIAKALTSWYGNKVEADDILFTVGGASALHIIFTSLNKKIPHGFIVTPFPYYSLYLGPQGENRLYPIPVMAEKGYRLTAEALSKALIAAKDQAHKEDTQVSAFLLCDPNNPLGTALDEDELKKIAKVLEAHPDIIIILDEAYAEMRWTEKYGVSLFSIAPQLKDQIIVIRSATKALSAAGERMAVMIATNKSIRTKLREELISLCGHAPLSSQIIYAEAFEKLDALELKKIKNYYEPQQKYALTRLVSMGAAMPDQDYRVDSTFYVMADLHELLGQEIPLEAQRILGQKGKIMTDEALVYSLLVEEGIAIAPLSYFGLPNQWGYMRITCSSGEEELKELFDRLERRLLRARQEFFSELKPELPVICGLLEEGDKAKTSHCGETINQNLTYQKASAITTVNESIGSDLSFFSQLPERKKVNETKNDRNKEWEEFIRFLF